MTPFPYSIEEFASLLDAREMMYEHHIHHLPVTKDGAICGVITDRDITVALARSEEEKRSSICVADVRTIDVYLVDLNARLDHVLIEMGEKRIGSAVVLKGDKLAGIFTVSDACRTFGEFLQELFPDGDDNLAA